MLVLSRQRGQAIMIGDTMEVTVVDIRGDKVRLGISAPRATSVHRKEIYDAIRQENAAAARVRPEDLHSGLNGIPIMRLAPPDLAVDPLQETPVTTSSASDPFLRAAIDEARKGLAEGGLPIGSVLVRDGQVIAAGHNRRVQRGDPMAHAEIDCLRQAGRIGRYGDTVLYSTLMPCYLCSGAVVQFGIKKVIVGESKTFPGGPEFMRQHGVEVTDLSDEECVALMKRFIEEKPQLWNEDIGL